MEHLLREAARLGYRTLKAEYIPTAKNSVVDEFYPSMGFTKVSTDSDKSEPSVVSYELQIDGAVAPISFLQPLS
jgi:predicted enzyme involved in methoxymalonyl-ACP biosynthesis